MAIAAGLAVFAVSCEKVGGENSTLISTSSSRSHYEGRNCMDCHVRGEGGSGWFTVAGTVYDSTGRNIYNNATVYLCSGPNGTGTILYKIPVDASGNYYTTENVNYTGGLYTAVKGATSTIYMAGKITDGECSRCHGRSTAKVWAK